MNLKVVKKILGLFRFFDRDETILNIFVAGYGNDL